MPLFSLPLIVEKVVTDYLAASFTDVPVFRAFRAGGYTFPNVTVKCAALQMDNPRQHVFSGILEVSIFTQVDDTTDLEASHDARVSAIYDLLANEAGLMTYANESGAQLHLWQATLANIEQGILETERVFGTTITVNIRCQNKPVG